MEGVTDDVSKGSDTFPNKSSKSAETKIKQSLYLFYRPLNPRVKIL